MNENRTSQLQAGVDVPYEKALVWRDEVPFVSEFITYNRYKKHI